MGAGAATIIGALIGAAAGDAKAQEQKKQTDKINKIEALKTLYSPWRRETGQYQAYPGQIGQIASGAMAGASMGQGMPMGGAMGGALGGGGGEAPPAGNMVMQSSQNGPASSPTGQYLGGNMSTAEYLQGGQQAAPAQPTMNAAMAGYNPYQPQPGYRQSSPGAVGNFYPYGNKP